MPNRTITFLILIVYTFCTYGQKINLNFPKLQGKEIRVYYFHGPNEDSLFVKLDGSGKGLTQLPQGYKGMIHIMEPESGGFECIGGEPTLEIECSGNRLSRELIRFPGSKENEFLYGVFDEKNRQIQLGEWIKAGFELHKSETSDLCASLRTILNKEKKNNDQQMEALNKHINSSDLYAAWFIRQTEFSDVLFTAENKKDTAKIRYVKDYIHHQMNWDYLYTSGQFWGFTHNYYLSMFNKEFSGMDKQEKQDRYASDIQVLLTEVPDSIRGSFLQSVISECERFSWDQAGDKILSYVIDNNISVTGGKGDLSRILAAYSTRKGSMAPALAGFQLPPIPYTCLLLIFYESGCGNCTVQLDVLKKRYEELHSKGVRIISISADNDKTVFEYHSKDFPWKDKLCDYKGFESENFKNYGIIGTPTIYIVNPQGVVAGRYATVEEAGLF